MSDNESAPDRIWLVQDGSEAWDEATSQDGSTEGSVLYIRADHALKQIDELEAHAGTLADEELGLVVKHIEACANALATVALPHASATSRSLHMLCAALQQKAHRNPPGRAEIVQRIVDTLRSLGHGGGRGND